MGNCFSIGEARWVNTGKSNVEELLLCASESINYRKELYGLSKYKDNQKEVMVTE